LFKLDDTPTDLPIRDVIRALTVRAEERLGSFEKFADAIHGLVGCEDIIGSLAAKRFHNSNKETEKAHAFQRFYANGGTKGREKGDQKSNSRAKKLEFGVGLA
jgi:hypothetical protein